jgi:hypothetical protein
MKVHFKLQLACPGGVVYWYCLPPPPATEEIGAMGR